MERRSLAQLGLNPKLATVAVHGSFANRQSDARPGELVMAMQALENGEDAIDVFSVNAYPVITN
jgi:hypothetical protein